MTRIGKVLAAACASSPTTVAEGRQVLERLAAESGALAAALATTNDHEARGWASALASQCRNIIDDLAWLAPWMSLPASARPQAHLPGFTSIPTLRELAALDDEWSGPARSRIAAASRLAAQATDLGEMEWSFLFDRTRHLLSIGYNVADRRRDSSYYDLLASEARFCTFVAIAQGHLPQESWFSLGRLLTTVAGEPVLLSWSGSMFEYLMPLVVMPGYDETLLDQTCKAVVRRQIEYGKNRGVPWGISESGYNLLDVRLAYQYRAFGVPGLGLKRGLADDLVIAPYASALALLVSPEEACANLQRLAAEGFAGELGFYEAIDYTPSRLPRGQSHALVRSYMAHHQGMTLLSVAHVLLDGRMQARFASDPACQATALLLQERIPRATALYLPPSPAADAGAARADADTAVRSFSGPDTPVPEVQLLSNGRYHVVVSNAGGGYSRWRDLAVTRWREDATSDNWGTFCYLKDVATGAVWSTAHQPTLSPADRFETILSEARAEFRSRTNQIESYTEIAVSPEDDVELRRLRLTNVGRARRTIEVTSYAEVALATSAADALHPAFSNLFVQTEIVPDQRAILCTRRPRSRGEPSPWMFHLMAAHGGAAGTVLSFETDRLRFVGRGRTAADPRAMHEDGPLAGSDGSVLDPIVAIRGRFVLEPDETVTIDVVSGVAETRAASLSLVGKYQDRRLANRVFALASTHAQVVLRQLDAIRGRGAALLPPRRLHPVRERVAARRPGCHREEPARAVWPVGLLRLGRPADRPAADRRRGQHRTRPPDGAGPRLLAPQGARGGPRDLERRSGRLPPGPPGADHRPHRRRHRGECARPAGRHLRPAGRTDFHRRPHPVPGGGEGRHHRQPRLAGGPDRRPPAGHSRRAVHAVPSRANAGSAAGVAAARRPGVLQRPRRVHA